MTRALLLSTVLLGWASTAAAQTFTCDPTAANANCDAVIPDASKNGTAGLVTSTLEVPQGDCPNTGVTGASLSLQILHPWSGDLSVTLTAPDGTTAKVFSRPGPSVSTDKTGCPREDVSARFFDSADGGVGCSFPTAVEGNLVPESPFSAFDGTPRAGTWTLRVTDSGKDVQGTLKSWSLTLPCTASTDGGTTPPPEVYIEATTPTANLTTGAAGVFRVTREGTTQGALEVSYTLSGTAPRSAYEPLPGTITIPDGATSATFEVKPVSSSTPEANQGTVVVTLAPGEYGLRDYTSAFVTLETEKPVTTVTPAKSGCGCQSGSPINSALPLLLGLGLLARRRAARQSA